MARLLDGSVSLHFLPNETQLRLLVAAPHAHALVASSPLLVYLTDDDKALQYLYKGWLTPPFDPRSRVIPSPTLPPAEADAAVRGFVQLVLDASPRPGAVVLDQNLCSQATASLTMHRVS